MGLRKVVISKECMAFVSESLDRTQMKFDYLLEIIIEQHIIPKNFVEKLVNTKYYELKIKVSNQYRIILFTLDTENINTSKEIILLNGFMKRKNKDYIKQVKIADQILKNHLDEK